MSFNPSSMIWSERYRPRRVSEMVGDFKTKIMLYLKDPKAIPHFLFYSKTPGTGKTTLAKAIINELGCDALIINSSDDRKIEVVRDRVKEFSITKSSRDDVKRVVFLDECDGMLKASQDALRNIMETYSSNVSFILTCNNINKVIEPLKSRCVMLPFAYPDKKEIKVYLTYICQKEKMEFTDEGLDTLIELNYPSIRNCVLGLQDLFTQQLAVVPENIKPVNEMFDEMWKLYKEKKWYEIKTVVLQSTVEPRELNTFFWNKFLEENNTKGIQITCRNEKDISVGADAKIVFISSLIELIK
jgi:replication factor C small subunit